MFKRNEKQHSEKQPRESSSPTATAVATTGATNGTGSYAPAPGSLFLRHHRQPLSWIKSTHLHLTDHEGRVYEWQSRRARKGRYQTKHHTLHHAGRESFVHIRIPHDGGRITPNLNADISFWIAVTFVFGSVIWVVNGFLSFLPFFYPWVGRNAIAKTNSALGFIGGVVFVGGSQLMITEALTRGREMDIKTALGRLLREPGIKDGQEVGTTGSATRPTAASSSPLAIDADSSSNSGNSSSAEGSTRALTTHPDNWKPKPEEIVWIGRPLWHDLGFMIAFWQLLAAIIFWVATLTGLHNVIPGMGDGRHRAVAQVLNWTPQVVGSVGFCISSTLQIIEVQQVWWKPEILDLGWQAGFWNLIGSIGFLLCGAFGYSINSGMKYQSSLSTFWGSWAFLIASTIMMFEVVFREPPETLPPTAQPDSSALPA